MLIVIGLAVLLLIAAVTIVGAKDDSINVSTSRLPPTPIGAEKTPPSGPVHHRPLPQPATNEITYGAPAIIPAVTEAAVRNRVARMVAVPGVTSRQPLGVTSVEFMTVGALRKKLGIVNMLSYYLETAPVVYVRLQGQFGVDQAEEGKPALNFTNAYMVFDAITGNFLADGAR